MTRYTVSVATRADGSADAWVVELPGCRAAAGSLDEALALLPVVAADHLAWLAGHGDRVTPDAPFEFDVIEEVSPAGDVIFDSDRTAMTREQLDVAIAQADYAHADLMRRLQHLPDAVLDWVPPATAVKIDQIFPEVRSMRHMLEHLSTVETNFYVGSLSEQPLQVAPPALAELHQQTAARLRALPDEALGRVFVRSGPRGDSEWSVRKALRRIINHKRFHTREIEQRLSWLTLGVPEILPRNRE